MEHPIKRLLLLLYPTSEFLSGPARTQAISSLEAITLVPRDFRRLDMEELRREVIIAQGYHRVKLYQVFKGDVTGDDSRNDDF